MDQSDNPPTPVVYNFSSTSQKIKHIIKSPKILITGLIIVIVLSVSIFLFINKNSSTNLSKSSPATLVPAKPTTSKIDNVFYHGASNPTGRDLYYLAYAGSKGELRFSGVGLHPYRIGTQFKDQTGKILFTTKNLTMSSYIVVSFVKWENIPKSADRYIILGDKLGVHYIDANVQAIPKIRIGFDTKNIDNKTHFATAIGVEDLNSVIPTVLDQVEGAKTYKFGIIGAFSDSDILQLIKPNDAVSLIILPDVNKLADIVDNNGIKVAGILYIRRYNPIQELPKEFPDLKLTLK